MCAASQFTRIDCLPLEVTKVNDIAPAMRKVATLHPEALLVGLDALTQANRQLIVLLATSHRLPTPMLQENSSMSAA